jgi:hypothetical protein
LLYAVCIASFLGGLHWGITLVFHELPVVYIVTALVWSVLPALAAWPLALFSIKSALPWAIVLLMVVFGGDLRMYKHYPIPSWFAALRGTLTVIAVLSLGAAWFALS